MYHKDVEPKVIRNYNPGDELVAAEVYSNMMWQIFTVRAGNIGGAKESTMNAPPPPIEFFFIFMQDLGKMGKIIGWYPTFMLGARPLKNFSLFQATLLFHLPRI